MIWYFRGERMIKSSAESWQDIPQSCTQDISGRVKTACRIYTTDERTCGWIEADTKTDARRALRKVRL